MSSNVGTENDKINAENVGQEDTNNSSNKKKWIIIGSIAGGIVLIVAIVLIVVFVTKDDDDSSSSSSSATSFIDDINVTKVAWDVAFSKADEDLEKLNLKDKINLLYGIGDMSDLSGKIAANSKINLDQINLQDVWSKNTK